MCVCVCVWGGGGVGGMCWGIQQSPHAQHTLVPALRAAPPAVDVRPARAAASPLPARLPPAGPTCDVEALVPLLHDPVLGKEGALCHAVHLRYGGGTAAGRTRRWARGRGRRFGGAASPSTPPRAMNSPPQPAPARPQPPPARPPPHRFEPCRQPHAHLLREACACIHDDGPQVAAGADGGDVEAVVKALGHVHVQAVVAHVVVVAAGCEGVGGEAGVAGVEERAG